MHDAGDDASTSTCKRTHRWRALHIYVAVQRHDATPCRQPQRHTVGRAMRKYAWPMRLTRLSSLSPSRDGLHERGRMFGFPVGSRRTAPSTMFLQLSFLQTECVHAMSELYYNRSQHRTYAIKCKAARERPIFQLNFYSSCNRTCLAPGALQLARQICQCTLYGRHIRLPDW